jgi:hypothetical protein
VNLPQALGRGRAPTTTPAPNHHEHGVTHARRPAGRHLMPTPRSVQPWRCSASRRRPATWTRHPGSGRTANRCS